MPPLQFATRINSFRSGGRSVADAVRLAASVSGISALELNFPQHVEPLGETGLAALLAETGLALTGLNLRFEGRDFAKGAFTAPAVETRQRAIDLARAAVDAAHRFGAGHIVLWMADDGWDVPLQVDYGRLWRDEVDGFREVAQRRSDIRVSVEYKPLDPRRASLIRSMGEALLAVADVARPNFGVTLDVCHSLMAGETPAAAAALALGREKLFGVHLNDGYGVVDDGLPIGSVRPAQLFDLLLVLRRGGYAGTYYFDTFPEREDPIAECAANISTVRRLVAAIDRIDPGALAQVQAGHDGLAALAFLREAGVG
jgi:xylose isomerase